MVSRRNGEFTRNILSALAAIVAAAVPSLIASPALADPPAGGNPGGSDTAKEEPAKEPAKAPAKHAGKHTKKPHASKPKAPGDAKKPDAKPASKPAEAQGDKPKGHDGATSAAQPKGKKTKKTASRGPSARKKAAAKKSDGDAPQKPCFGAAVTIDRGGLEGQSIPLVDCHGAPLASAREELSLLARPWSAARPKHLRELLAKERAQAKKSKADAAAIESSEIAPGVRLVDRGLLVRLDAIAQRFPGRPVSLVSGYRPQSRGSQHQSARALDLRVAGVSNEELVAFCKTLTDTACGYYPNSSFVHVDVRNPGTGSVSWIDASGPHEAPRYVKQWPLPDADTDADTKGVEPHDGTADPWELDRDPYDDADDPKATDSAKEKL
jgi:Peptidase M15